MTSLDQHEYRELLECIPLSAHSDSLPVEPRTLFTPRGHRFALDPDVTIVKGGRGVGKTVWFQVLQNRELREIAAAEYKLPQIKHVDTYPGYGATKDDRNPSQKVLLNLLSAGKAPLDVWKAVVLFGLGTPQLSQLDTWTERVDWVQNHPEQEERAFIAADRTAVDKGRVQLFLFDRLEWLAGERKHTDQLVTGILKLALEMRITTRKLRAKVFIRHDMLDNLTLNFADASKILANHVDLTWPRTNLYGLLFHHMGNADTPLSERFRTLTGTWEHHQDRYVIPQQLLGDEEVQQREFVKIAGQYMGSNHRRGHTYTWVPNHLADGANQVSPRSFLEALRKARESTLNKNAGHPCALHWNAIKEGVQAASDTRVNEVSEDIGWVKAAIDPLHGKQVPIEQREIEDCWDALDLQGQMRERAAASTSDDPVSTGPHHLSSAKLIEELIQLGIMLRRKNDKIDLPDIYRLAFGLGRKGGVPRTSSS